MPNKLWRAKPDFHEIGEFGYQGFGLAGVEAKGNDGNFDDAGELPAKTNR
jgi:hypothetical protein